MRSPLRKRGFAVRELVIVVLVLAVVAGVLFRCFADVWVELAATACDQNVSEINGAIERWYLAKGSWPEEDLSDLGGDKAHFPDGLPCCPVTGEAYRMDPQSHRVWRHQHGRSIRASRP